MFKSNKPDTVFVSIQTNGIKIEHEKRQTLYYNYEQYTFSDQTFTGKITKVHKLKELIGFLRLPNIVICIGVSDYDIITVGNMIIHEVKDIVIIPFVPPSTKPEWIKEDMKMANDIKKMLDDCLFYYSYTMNITLNTQEAMKNNERIDNRFYWNKHMHQMIEHCDEQWKVVFVDGFVRTTSFGFVNYLLFSRRDCSRTGLRYSSRGSDINGNVSNFVETEQLLVFNQKISSFVEIRGNIPLIWKTNEEETLNPKGKFYQTIFQDWCITNHFLKLKELYGQIMAINLLDNHGAEKLLHDMYEFYLGMHSNLEVEYYAFDFHKECANNKYENVSKLMNMIKKELNNHGFFVYDSESKMILKQQKGVVRTNCIDCLDRTNVVQCSIAKEILGQQLLELGFDTSIIESVLSKNEDFMNMWADHANQMSFRYTGTKAMKTDFTRNGKRGIGGMLSDGKTSVKRSIISMKTGQYQKPQELLDFILGKKIFGEVNESCNEVDLCITDVYKTDTSIKSGDQIPVHIHIKNNMFIEYQMKTLLIVKKSLDDIIACDLTNDPRILFIYSKETSLPHMYIVHNIHKSYQLCQLLNKKRLSKPPSVNLYKSIMKSSMEFNTITKELSICLCRWNMEKIITPPSHNDLTQNIINAVKDQDIFILQLYKCNYEPSMYVGDYTSDFDLFKNVYGLLNVVLSPYLLVAIHTTKTVSQCMYIKKEKYRKIHNVEVSHVYYEKSKPQKYSKLKSYGSAIMFSVNENTFAFLCLHGLSSVSEDESMFLKSQMNLDYDVKEVFFTVFENLQTNYVPSFDFSVKTTTNSATLGSIYQRSIWDYVTEMKRHILDCKIPRFKEIDVESINKSNDQQRPYNKYDCLLSSLTFNDFQNPTFVDSSLINIHMNSIHLKLTSKIDKSLVLTFTSKVLTSLVMVSCVPSRKYEADCIPSMLSLNHFDMNVLKSYWITCVITEQEKDKQKQIGKFIVPLTVVLTGQSMETCIIYNNKYRVGECIISLSLKSSSLKLKQQNIIEK